jgi:hypothetical protein
MMPKVWNKIIFGCSMSMKQALSVMNFTASATRPQKTQQYLEHSVEQMIIDGGIDLKLREILSILSFIIWRERYNCSFRDQAKPLDFLMKEESTE